MSLAWGSLMSGLGVTELSPVRCRWNRDAVCLADLAPVPTYPGLYWGPVR